MENSQEQKKVPFWVQISTSIIRNRHFPNVLAILLILNVGVLFVSLANPVMFEGLAFGWSFSVMILNATLIGIISALAIGASVNISSLLIAQGIHVAKSEIKTNQQLLPATSGDTIVSAHPNESPSDFWDRVDYVKNILRPGGIMIIIPFKNENIIIYDGKPKEVLRTKLAPCLHQPLLESEDEYNGYVKSVSDIFQSFCMEKRRQESKSGDVLTDYVSAARAALTVLLFVLSVSAYGQNNGAKIDAALSGKHLNIQKGDNVTVVFSDGSAVTRVSDGVSSVRELFIKYPGADSAPRGEVKGISINNVAQEINQQSKAVKPLFEESNRAPISLSSTVPDSGAIREMLAPLKSEGDKIREKIWQALIPVWEMLMYLFGSLFWLALCAGGLFWYMATTARQNGNLGKTVAIVQRWASARVLIICWVFTAITLINSFLWLVYNDYPMWLVVAAWAIILTIARWLTNYIVPNGKDVHFQEYREWNPNNQIGSGR